MSDGTNDVTSSVNWRVGASSSNVPCSTAFRSLCSVMLFASFVTSATATSNVDGIHMAFDREFLEPVHRSNTVHTRRLRGHTGLGEDFISNTNSEGFDTDSSAGSSIDFGSSEFETNNNSGVEFDGGITLDSYEESSQARDLGAVLGAVAFVAVLAILMLVFWMKGRDEEDATVVEVGGGGDPAEGEEDDDIESGGVEEEEESEDEDTLPVDEDEDEEEAEEAAEERRKSHEDERMTEVYGGAEVTITSGVEDSTGQEGVTVINVMPPSIDRSRGGFSCTSGPPEDLSDAEQLSSIV